MSNFTYKWAFFSHLTCCECQMPGLPLLSWKMIIRLWYWRTHDSVILTKLRALLVQVTTLDFILLWNFNYSAYHHLLQIKAIQYRKQKWLWNKMLSNTITIYKCHWCIYSFTHQCPFSGIQGAALPLFGNHSLLSHFSSVTSLPLYHGKLMLIALKKNPF